MHYIRVVLAAEPRADDLDNLVRCLARTGVKILAATSVQKSLELLRAEIFDAAVAAVELDLAGEPMLAHLARLPATRRLVAVGPGGNWQIERRARFAGAAAYVARPVTSEILARALRVPLIGGNQPEIRSQCACWPRAP